MLGIRPKSCFLLLVAFVWASAFSFHVMLTRRQLYREHESAEAKNRLIGVLRAARERNGEQKEVVNLVAELYEILELKLPGVEVAAVPTARNKEGRSKGIHNNKKSTRPPFVFITPMEKAWKNAKPLRNDLIVPVHRKLPAERPVDNNGNLMYPIINDIQPMDFDDVMPTDTPAPPMTRMVPEEPSLKTIDAPLLTHDTSEDRNDVLKAQAEYRAYMASALAQRRLKRSR